MKTKFQLAQAFLFALAAASAFSSSLNDLVNRSKGRDVAETTLQSDELFARRDVSGQGGIFEFINNEVDKAQGLVNFDKGRLAQNEAFIFDAISISFGEADAGDVTAGAVDYTADMIAALKNAEFEIKQSGRKVISLPVASLYNPYVGSSEKDNWTELGNLHYLVDNEDFTWNIKFPSNLSVPQFTGSTGSKKSFLQVRLRGYRTSKRSI
ncbi:hypothetical protein [Flavobacteriaceae bacterium 14752]|uniref:hypothetical protein n=1 Tax=Mesohalobacter salilacus TaxID=2491711 RepID=UPI000F630129|nr:hypothetical protein EIG84_05870 [Flavobacteriaceae bacterium 14752]